jgi:predicted transcriptional regulator of viral defense system
MARPIHAFARPWSLSAITAVELALADEPHYIGGLVAFTLHRLTEQIHSSVVDAYVLRRRNGAIIASARVRFHRIPQSAIGLGTVDLLVEQLAVCVSDPERTLLDALDRPAAVGGLTEAVRLVAHGLAAIDPSRLVAYALELSPPSTLQRIGVLMERAGVRTSDLLPLVERVRGTSNKPAMVPGARRGRLHPLWHIIENDIPPSSRADAAATPGPRRPGRALP